MSIEDVARELYGLAPEDFTAARNAAAKEAKGAGDPDLAARVQSLRKPTAGAWLVNQWVRGHADEVQQLLELGARLRAAQGTLGAEELRALDQQRRQLTRAMAAQASAVGREAGRRVTDATTAQVEETLRSAMVDEVAGAALATGLLTDTFSSTGLDPVDLWRVVALAPASAPAPAAPEADADPDTDEQAEAARQRALAEAESAATDADAAAQTARQVVERAEADAAEAQRRRAELESRREEARRHLHDLDRQVTEATEAAEAAIRLREAAARDETTAAQAADRLREQLQALRR